MLCYLSCEIYVRIAFHAAMKIALLLSEFRFSILFFGASVLVVSVDVVKPKNKTNKNSLLYAFCVACVVFFCFNLNLIDKVDNFTI